MTIDNCKLSQQPLRNSHTTWLIREHMSRHYNTKPIEDHSKKFVIFF